MLIEPKNEASKIILCVEIPISGYVREVPTSWFGKQWKKVFPRYKHKETRSFLLTKTPKIEKEDVHTIVSGVKRVSGDDGNSYQINEWEYAENCFFGNFKDHPKQFSENFRWMYPKKEEIEKVIQKYLDRGWSPHKFQISELETQ